MESGYAAASTLEIASRARVSKRELYSLVGNKQLGLLLGVTERPGPREMAARARDAAAAFLRIHS